MSGRDSHLGYLKFAIIHWQKCAASHTLATGNHKKNLTAPFKDGLLRIGEHCFVLWFYFEVLLDPLLIERAKRGLVACLERTNEDLFCAQNWTTQRHFLVPPASISYLRTRSGTWLHSSLPATWFPRPPSVSPRP